MTREIERQAARLILAERWAALATVADGAPEASMVAYAPEPLLGGILLFLSSLAQHTGNLLSERRASLVISRPDPGSGDPQELPRASVQGEVVALARQDPSFDSSWRCYVERFPQAGARLALADFTMFRLVPSRVRYVGGFAQAVTIDAARLAEAAAEL